MLLCLLVGSLWSSLLHKHFFPILNLKSDSLSPLRKSLTIRITSLGLSKVGDLGGYYHQKEDGDTVIKGRISMDRNIKRKMGMERDHNVSKRRVGIEGGILIRKRMCPLRWNLLVVSNVVKDIRMWKHLIARERWPVAILVRAVASTVAVVADLITAPIYRLSRV